MSRITLAGTPLNPYRLTKHDLPEDHDLRYSHLYYVDAIGFDLSAYDCDWMDWIHCSARGVTIPTGARALFSHKTDWTGAHLPSDFSHLNRDFLIEALNQQAEHSTSNDAATLLSGSTHVTDHVGGSWRTIVPALEAQGHAREDVYRVGAAAFENYPDALHRWEEEFKRKKWKTDLWPTVSPFLNVVLPTAGRTYIPNKEWPDDLKAAWMLRDRWLCGRLIEKFLTKRIPEGQPWSATVYGFEPAPWVDIHPPYPEVVDELTERL